MYARTPRYGLIVSDLDGTLLSGNGEIAEGVLTSLAKAKGAGIRFTIATGRAYGSSKRFLDVLQPNAPIVLHNGAQIYDHQNGKTIRSTPIPRRDARRIVEIARRFDVHVNLFLADGVYYEKVSADGQFSWKVDDLTPTRENLMDVISHERPLKLQIVKKRAEELDRIVSDIAPLLPAGVAAIRSEPFCYEIGAVGASKASAVRYLANHCGLALCRVIACGDGANDVGMLRTVMRAKGIAVAPWGAVREITRLESVQVVPAGAGDVLSFVVNRLCFPSTT